MSRKIDINSPEWCNIVFEGRNKDYGAYKLRQLSGRRHIKSLIILMILFVVVMFLPKLIDSVIPEQDDKPMTEVTNIRAVKVETQKPKDVITIEVPKTPIIKSTIKFTPPVIKPDDQVTQDVQMKTQDKLNLSKATISVTTVEGNDTTGLDPPTTGNNALTGDSIDTKKVYPFVDQMPEYPGGQTALLKFLYNHIRYPVTAEELGIEGRVYVHFIVDKEGNVTNCTASVAVHPSLEQEAIRVVSSLPRWNPGKQGGVAVRVSYTVPIIFVLRK